jgi:hypothetical protein
MTIKEKLPDEFKFLLSTRFWALVITALTVYAQQKGLITEAELALIGTITGGFVAVRTIDRASEKVGKE